MDMAACVLDEVAACCAEGQDQDGSQGSHRLVGPLDAVAKGAQEEREECEESGGTALGLELACCCCVVAGERRGEEALALED